MFPSQSIYLVVKQQLLAGTATTLTGQAASCCPIANGHVSCAKMLMELGDTIKHSVAICLKACVLLDTGNLDNQTNSVDNRKSV